MLLYYRVQPLVRWVTRLPIYGRLRLGPVEGIADYDMDHCLKSWVTILPIHFELESDGIFCDVLG